MVNEVLIWLQTTIKISNLPQKCEKCYYCLLMPCSMRFYQYRRCLRYLKYLLVSPAIFEEDTLPKGNPFIQKIIKKFDEHIPFNYCMHACMEFCISWKNWGEGNCVTDIKSSESDEDYPNIINIGTVFYVTIYRNCIMYACGRGLNLKKDNRLLSTS